MIAVATDNSLFEIIKDVNKLYDYQLEQISTQEPEKVYNSLLKKDFSMIIVDIEYFDSQIDELLKYLKMLNTATNCRIITIARGYEQSSLVLQELKLIGSEEFITDSFEAGIKKNLIEILNKPKNITTNCRDVNQNDSSKQKYPTIPEKPDPQELFPAPPKHITSTIAVCGVIRRIGTTTQAMQAVKYLQTLNKKVCYIQINSYGNLESFLDYYDDLETDIEIGKIVVDSIDMYYRPEKISEILKLDYDFIVYDFGSIADMSIVPYLEKDIKLVVCGSKAYEMPSLMNAFKKFDNDNVNYLFSFTPLSEQFMIREQMGEKSDVTFFPAYTPSLFSYSSDNQPIHEIILKTIASGNIEKKKEPETKKSLFPFNFFSRRKVE